ncbi:glycosyltransferase family 2 protein [archaeon]|jgi:dolichyl-phosphate beta-glucosyltransferase|nr:glycosyltransferase family 2 protein [archaeon]MBT4272421.1 glycosyltransferase family 2 protein [archaeon]MBT4461738.1 glycosyltransferase family 2 protein [archaeon]MBT5424331.1 glycosyltransferase family 2 protein [archaeon]MBT7439604.1 glycosyltransferase family 2 protein [archaeon]
MKLLSIIIPAYNEEKRIIKTLNKIQKYLLKKKISYEIIVVDDGSKDKTIQLIKKLKDNKIIVKQNSRNRGKGYSTKKGMLAASGKYALLTDADLSTPIEELDKFLELIPKYDLVIGSRKTKESKLVVKQPFYRVLAGNVLPILVNIFVLRGIKDTQCGFKLFNTNKCKILFKKQTIEGFAFDVELMYIAKKHHLKIKEQGVYWYNDLDSKFSLFKHTIPTILDLVKVRLNDLQKKYD